jgi:hypothetical protein
VVLTWQLRRGRDKWAKRLQPPCRSNPTFALQLSDVAYAYALRLQAVAHEIEPDGGAND